MTTTIPTNIIGSLRALMPTRPINLGEALRIAELQANRLRQLTGSTEPAFPDTAITGLPRIKVQTMSPLPMSGYTTGLRGGLWLIVLNGGESPLRQRFSLAHEFKHILDHPFIEQAYSKIRGQGADEWAEKLCDYFAGCLLMPKVLVKRLYCNEAVQELPTLARRFHVSQAAMRVRLLQLGLAEQGPRCAPYRREAPAALVLSPSPLIQVAA
jgi:hypothetical protein